MNYDYHVSVLYASYSTALSSILQVTGFSVGGRVVDGNQIGVEGVQIIVDGHERFITDKQGYYKLDQVLKWGEVLCLMN